LSEDILLPEAGRNVAAKIGALYYETSVLEEFGLDHMFTNILRAALVGRRSRHFYLAVGPLKNISLPVLQEPHLVPQPQMPVVAASLLSADADFSSLLGNPAFVDVVFDICGVIIGAHSACLATSSTVFCDLLSIVVLGANTSSTVRVKDTDVTSSVCTGTTLYPDSILLNHTVFKSFVHPTKADDGSLVPAKVTVSDTVSLSAFRVVLHFLYAGTLPPLMAHWCPDVHHLAELLAMPSLEQAVANISTAEDFLNAEIYRNVCRERCSNMKSMLVRDGMFSGTCFV